MTAEKGVPCESGDPACGPAVFEDGEGVRLCQACMESLEIESQTQRRARELGLSLLGGGAEC